MQALDDFRLLRFQLKNALEARATMRDRSLAQCRRDVATQAYTRACDDLVELLRRLDDAPMVIGPESKSTLATLEDVLAAIQLGETAFAARGVA